MEKPDIQVSENQTLTYDNENKYWFLTGEKGWGTPILKCPMCNKWKKNLYHHSKTKICNFDFESIFKFKERYAEKNKNII